MFSTELPTTSSGKGFVSARDSRSSLRIRGGGEGVGRRTIGIWIKFFFYFLFKLYRAKIEVGEDKLLRQPPPPASVVTRIHRGGMVVLGDGVERERSEGKEGDGWGEAETQECGFLFFFLFFFDFF